MLEKFSVNPNVISSDLDGHETIFNPKTSLYFGLDEIGSIVWAEIGKEPKTMLELVQGITKIFDVSPTVLEKDLEALLIDLQNADLIRTSKV